MKKVLTVGQVIASRAGIEKLLQTEDISGTVAFRLIQLLDAVNPVLSAFDKSKTTLVTRFAEKEPGTSNNVFVDEQKTQVKIGDMEGFIEALTPVLAETVEVKSPELKESDIAGIKIQPALLMQIMWMFEGHGETPTLVPGSALEKKKRSKK